MLHYALVFFVIALVAALLGFFNGVAGLSARFGWLFAVIAVVILALGLLSGRTPGSHRRVTGARADGA